MTSITAALLVINAWSAAARKAAAMKRKGKGKKAKKGSSQYIDPGLKRVDPSEFIETGRPKSNPERKSYFN